MPIETVLSAKGLQTSPNNLGAGSVGALVEASNVMIRYPDVIEPRRGQQFYAQAITGAGTLDQMILFQDTVVVHSSSDQLHYYDGDPTLETIGGTITPARDDQRLKSAVSASNLHLATDAGVQVLEDLTNSRSYRPSGLPFPTQPFIDLYAATDPANNWLDNGNSVAYRIVFGYVDLHDRLYLGPPSPFPITISNTSGSGRAVSIRIDTTNLPTLSSGDLFPRLFVQVYRSAEFTTGIQPNDELYLVTERFFQPTETTVITINDETPSNLVGGAKLYTNPTAEGAVQENSPAPFARDVASWDQRLWYANTEQPQSLNLQIVGVGGTTGLQVGDKIRFAYADDSVIVTMEAVAGVPTDIDEFTITTTGSASERVDNTTRSLVLNLCDYFISPVTPPPCRPFIVPGTATSPSSMFLQGADGVRGDRQAFTVSLIPAPITYTRVGVTGLYFGAAPHTVTDGYKIGDTISLRDNSTGLTETRTITNIFTTGPVDVALNSGYGAVGATGTTTRNPAVASAAFNPQLPIYGVEALDVVSSNDAAPNRLYYSKGDLPEAVPVLNYVNVGTSDKAILRIYPNRNRLLVFKEEGTFVVYGGEGLYTVQLLDDTVQLLAPDSIASVGSAVFALMDDGVVQITESSLAPVSEVIQASLLPYLGTEGRSLAVTAFGVAHESDQLYSLWFPDTPYSRATVYVYGIRSKAWTTWDLAGKCGRVNPVNDTLYWALTANRGPIYAEKHASRRQDYADINSTGAASAYKCRVTYAATVLGNAALSKQAREIHTHLRVAEFQSGNWTLTTDISRGVSANIPVAPGSVYNATTNNPWVGPPVAPNQYRALIPQEYQRGTYFNWTWQTNEAYAYWALNGISTVFESTSERTTK